MPLHYAVGQVAHVLIAQVTNPWMIVASPASKRFLIPWQDLDALIIKIEPRCHRKPMLAQMGIVLDDEVDVFPLFEL
ncbi:hypothetical protein [Rhizobium sp. YK2]|uniref:hypothetical protein n=1 Tax=Rhizobium sp. YK2 TaxID=1860096 RepID=UPI00114CC92A|nr:hypothetical protein [Rhizobium sp. YK2]